MGTASFFIYFPTPFFYIVYPFLSSIIELGITHETIFYRLKRL